MPRTNDLNAAHFLGFNLHEDEAQHMAMLFKVVGPDAVFVVPLHHCAEYQDYTESRTMTRAEARAEWKRLLAETTRGFTGRNSIDHVYSKATNPQFVEAMIKFTNEFYGAYDA